MKKTKTQKIMEMLIKKGCYEVSCRSGKYRAFESSDNIGMFYFVGKRGALRYGECATKSMSCTYALQSLFLKYNV